MSASMIKPLLMQLNEIGYRSFQAGFVYAKDQGYAYLALAHWLDQILKENDADIHGIIRAFELRFAVINQGITRLIENVPPIKAESFYIKDHVEALLINASAIADQNAKRRSIRTGHLLLAGLNDPFLRLQLQRISAEFNRIDVADLKQRFVEIVADSPEETLNAMADAQQASPAAPSAIEQEGEFPSASSLSSPELKALNKYATDLTEKAKNGELDPIVGRDTEIRQIIDILLRRRQNNPILTGEAGVGKTAVVEGLAVRINQGDVPPVLQDVRLFSLDVGLLQAGASMKGQFESRLKQVIQEVQTAKPPVIVFIDEAHTLIGAGGAAGTGDAANLLKPALARGTLRTIAATTWSEYKQYIENDPALTRRFQVVHIAEPDKAKALTMLRSIAPVLAQHHGVQVLEEALVAAVDLSQRFMTSRQLPDKAVSLLDTTCARVGLSFHSPPSEVETLRRDIEILTKERQACEVEVSLGIDVKASHLDALRQDISTKQADLKVIEARWEQEKAIVSEIVSTQTIITGQSAETEVAPEENAVTENTDDSHSRLTGLKQKQAELAEIQGESPLVLPNVNAQAIASVVADWTGIPVGRMRKVEVASVLKLADTLGERVKGQDHAIDAICRRIETARANLDNPQKPVGVFLLCGPSGVGKTETGLALAEALFGSEEHIITINMSEYQEAHSVSTLKGAPPGYVGYGKGGLLTEAVRRRPYSIILLDEVEKAHSDVHEIFFQVFDKGGMEDAEGRYIDFKNTVILLTSNVGTERIIHDCSHAPSRPAAAALAQALRPDLLAVFPPALLGRLVVIPFFPLNDALITKIIRLQLSRIEQRVQAHYQVPFDYDESVVTEILRRCDDINSGARMIDQILTQTLLPAMSREILQRQVSGEAIRRLHIRCESFEFHYSF